MSNLIGNINRVVPGLQPGANAVKPDKSGPEGTSFAEMVGEMIQSVNGVQAEAAYQQELMASGNAEDLHQVMLAAEKAGIALDLLLEIRNKLVDAYQNFMQMPI